MDKKVRGVILTTDGILAATLAATIMASSLLAFQATNKNNLEDLAMIRIAYDIGLTFDEAGIISSNNVTQIEESLMRNTPDNMNVSLEVVKYAFRGENITAIYSRTYGRVDSESHITQQVISTDAQGGCYVTRIKVGLK